MPSPIAHTLAGLSVGWIAQGDHPMEGSPTRDALSPLALWCAFIAAIPDADLVIPHFHRTATHSLTATALVFIVTAGVTGKVTGPAAWRLAAVLSAAQATHLVLDWLGTDRFPPSGIQVWWPFSQEFFISGLDVFPPIDRRLSRPGALAVNAYAGLWELVIMGPVAAAVWVVRVWRRRGPVARGQA